MMGVSFPIAIKRRHLVAALLIILVGLIALYYFAHTGAVEQAGKCSAKGLEIFQLDNSQICRDHDTGLLYAP
jgi:hypothetical protein